MPGYHDVASGCETSSQPQALSMGTHESQSLLWERMVALSPAFARYLTPLLRESFPQLPADLSPEQVYGAVNAVKFPSLIRVEADEIQYPLHIVLRYDYFCLLLAQACHLQLARCSTQNCKFSESGLHEVETHGFLVDAAGMR